MKKSFAYKLAMATVVESELDAYTKLDVLKVLIKDEELALYSEERYAEAEKLNNTVGGA